MSSPTSGAGGSRHVSELTIRPYSVDEHRCVVTLAGDLDLASGPSLKAALTELCELGYTQFVLDLSEVAHMDSTGLGVLVGFQNRLEGGGRLALAAVPANVARLLSVVGLESAVESFPDVDAALGETEGAAPRSALELDARPPAPGAAGAPATPSSAGRVAADTDAGLVLGLASTALPFAESELAEAERWLRILRRYGDAGVILQESGVKEARFADFAADQANSAAVASAGAEGRLAAVTEQAHRTAAARGTESVGTVDILKAVMAIYGAQLDRVLAAYGGDRARLEEHLAGH